MRPIWMQLDYETDRAYWDFEVYRDMGPGRSIRKAGKKMAKNHKSLAKLSKKYHWRERVHAFDAYVAQRKAEAVVGDAVEMHRRHVETATLIKNVARAPLAELAWRLDNTDFLNYGSVSTSDLLKLAPTFVKIYKEGTDMGRVARGFEEKGAEDKSTTIDVKSLLNNPEFIRFVETFIHNRPEQMTSLHQDAQSEDTRVEEVEGSVESKESPTPHPVLRRRPKPVNGDSSVVKNQ